MSSSDGKAEEPPTSNIALQSEYLTPKKDELTNDQVIDFLK